MKTKKVDQLVFTVKERCRVCYTCVRSCPAKAIRIEGGQAEVINSRCIGCGNCTRVCSQGAKVFLRSVDQVYNLLKSDVPVAACLAPSFPAEFTDIEDYKVLVGMLRQLGFTYVTEVAFGADIVARKYKELLVENEELTYISANCPAIVHYVRQYQPNLTGNIAPIASPMVAMTRILRKKYGEDLKTVLIGPCIAKKSESPEIDETLTFIELRDMFKISKIEAETISPSEFDPPYGGRGALFSISRGMLQTVDIEDNVLNANIIVAEGNLNFLNALKEYESGLIKNQHLELLCCEGCIMGPGMSQSGNPYHKRTMVSNYVRHKVKYLQREKWEEEMLEFKDMDFSQEYEVNDQRLPKPSKQEIDKVLQRIGKYNQYDHLNCGACGYNTCEEHAIAIIEGLAESEMCLPYAIEQLHQSIDELDISNEMLRSAQQALKQSEKLASMGQLSAGIAHELNNPLGVVIMYSNILLDETPADSPVREDLKLIAEQADRCKKIVSGLLNFARKNQVKADIVNMTQLAQQCLQSVIIPNNITTSIRTLAKDPELELDREQMMQVFTNLARNAFEAMPEGGEFAIICDGNDKEAIFRFSDSGTGISPENLDKIFEPFFTTKPIGKGTGLGLATAYGIIKMHRGRVEVSSNTDPTKGKTGTTFTIALPRSKNINDSKI